MRVFVATGWWGGLALALLSAPGCGEPSLGPTVSGKATYQGQSLGDGAVTFFPTTGRPTTAPLDSDGEYSVELPPGDYDVVINVGVKLPPGFKEGDPLPPAKIVLPREYTTRAKSTLSATVAPDRDQPIDFELK